MMPIHLTCNYTILAVWTPLVGPNEEELEDQPNTVENEDWPPNIESPDVCVKITILTMFFSTLVLKSNIPPYRSY